MPVILHTDHDTPLYLFVGDNSTIHSLSAAPDASKVLSILCEMGKIQFKQMSDA